MLNGKTAIITGASRGIGKQILIKFAESKANIIACSNKESSELLNYYKELENKENIKIKPYFFDFNLEDQSKEFAKKISSENDNIDILVNNAGEIQTSLFLMTPIKKIRENFEINYFSQIIFTQIIIKKMIRKKKGSIVNISTTSAIDGIEGRLAYSSSKAALASSTKVLSRELGQMNIRVNAIAPGLTNTDLMHKSHPEHILKQTIDSLSLKRIAEPEEIASAVLFLASDMSSYITGEVIRVDGGMK